MTSRRLAAAVVLASSAALPVLVGAQAPSRLAILVAEDRRAPTAYDLATIRAGLRSRDLDTARVAVRAIGRLERPELVPDILPLLKSPLPEIRAEAANAVAQAAHGWTQPPVRAAAVKKTGASKATPAMPASINVAAVASALAARLGSEDEGTVRGAICQALGRLPYTTAEQVAETESTLTTALAREDSTDGRLGVAQGLESLIRINRKIAKPSVDARARLTELASGSATTGAARIRRLALEALITADAVSDAVVARAAADADPQLRRLAVRATTIPNGKSDSASEDVVKQALADPSAMVRIEALRALGIRGKGTESACAAATKGVGDREPQVVLAALDQLTPCSSSADALAVLEQAVAEVSSTGDRWHRPAHAIVALAGAAPDRARSALPSFVASPVWQMRMYAARAAAALSDRAALEKLAADADDNVCEAAIEALSKVAGHDADASYRAALGRRGYQAVRAAALALTSDGHAAADGHDSAGSGDKSARGSSETAAVLKTNLDRLNAEAHDNSRDARTAIADALDSIGVHVDRPGPVREMTIDSDLSAEDLRRLSSARARVTMRGGAAFELALFTSQAPATVVRFVHLIESGYYNGLTFHRIVPNFVIQGGSPAANEYVGDASYMRDEVGLWPHVRGAVGISTRGRDTGDAQIFIDLVDNPRLDHEYTVFAQVLSPMDVVDRILEGDVIEKVDVLTR
jgi:cyclophilin family peptidyl-prolyl cis-trans isomerase/HEAT repeat protein